ncbi:SETMR methyltransferase, partial [Acromyrmex heyeri]
MEISRENFRAVIFYDYKCNLVKLLIFLSSKNVELMTHCPYSPDLSPNDFFLFPNIKKKMRGERFELSEAVETFRTLISEVQFERMQKCIDLKGEYFEK